MRVNLFANPKNPEGLAVSFGYDKRYVDEIKSCLGLQWDKPNKMWTSVGPEVLLDMDRFKIQIEYMSPEARLIANDFRQQLWNSLDARSEPIGDIEYGFQRQGARFLASQKRAILGDSMGVGKSKQALDALAEIGAQTVLVLCPKTITYNWLAEVEKWHPKYSAKVVPDAPRERKEFWDQPLPDIVIANYEKLRLGDWPYQMDWEVLILDECSRLKTQTTVTYKAVKRISKFSNYVWGLTGTPLEIRLEELYAVFSLLRPAVLGGYYRFRDQHCQTDWAGTVIGSKNLPLLRDRIGYWMLRRTKEEVLTNLPPKIYNNEWIKMTPLEQREYQELVMEFGKFLNEHGVGGSSDPLVQTIRLRQFCCSPALLSIERRGSKYEALLELIKEWDGRVLVFCFFEQMISLLSNWLQADIGYNPRALISGNIAAAERLERVNSFNNGELGKVFLSTDAGNQGINLTGASLVVQYDQIWNTQKMRQREDRAHRIGQKDSVNVANLLIIDTIDAGMYQLGKERQQLFDDVIEEAESSMRTKLSIAKWRKIVEGKLAG